MRWFLAKENEKNYEILSSAMLNGDETLYTSPNTTLVPVPSDTELHTHTRQKI